MQQTYRKVRTQNFGSVGAVAPMIARLPNADEEPEAPGFFIIPKSMNRREISDPIMYVLRMSCRIVMAGNEES